MTELPTTLLVSTPAVLERLRALNGTAPPPWADIATVTDAELAAAGQVRIATDMYQAGLKNSTLERLRMLGRDHTDVQLIDVSAKEEKVVTAKESQDKANATALLLKRARDYADRTVEAEQLAEVIGTRVRMSGREFAAQPKPKVVMEGILAAEVNLLVGPEASGKSLWQRDIALHVATGTPWRGHEVTQPREVVLCFSEGTHDFEERYTTHPLWEAAQDHIWIVEDPFSLTIPSDVDWFLGEYGDLRPGLVGFDVVTGFGMDDDNGSKDVLPVLGAMKRISKAWEAATWAVGHPPHGGAERMRGSSAWRQLAYTDWFMADGKLSCKKSKIARASSLSFPHVAEYPTLRWRALGEVMADAAAQAALLAASFAADPTLSDHKRAALLCADLGVEKETARKRIAAYRKGLS